MVVKQGFIKYGKVIFSVIPSKVYRVVLNGCESRPFKLREIHS